jgi:tRNA threonylcarbamoyladenosine biosynthesis protein TsaB
VLVLAVESATESAGVALADESGFLGSVVVARGRRHTETMAPAIEVLCRRVGVTLGRLDVLGVDVGPGLFTGLRVGIATVKALAFALGIPVATATSLEVLAHGVMRSGLVGDRTVVPVVDARRGEVFSARFRAGPAGLVAVGDTGPGGRGEGPPTGATGGRLWSPEDLADDLGRSAEPVVAAGDGALRYGALFGAVSGVTLAGPAFGAPPVAALAELAVARGLGGLVGDGAGVLPSYLRPADARINWEQRMAPRATTESGR